MLMRKVVILHLLSVSIELVNAFVSSRIDYCNSLYYGATDIVHRKLQSVMNAAARKVTGQRRFDHISETLLNRHWLGVPQRIIYKIWSITRPRLHGRALTISMIILHL